MSLSSDTIYLGGCNLAVESKFLLIIFLPDETVENLMGNYVT